MWRLAWTAACCGAPAQPGNAVFRRGGDAPAMYFAPAARELAEAFGASECDPPSPDGLFLVAGPSGAWAACFPGVAQPAQAQAPDGPGAGERLEDFEPTIPSTFDQSFRPTLPSML